MRTIIDLIVTIIFLLFTGTAALKVADQFIKEVAIKKISRGLLPLSPMTRAMTRDND